MPVAANLQIMVLPANDPEANAKPSGFWRRTCSAVTEFRIAVAMNDVFGLPRMPPVFPRIAALQAVLWLHAFLLDPAPARVLDVASFGAAGDGRTDDAAAIGRAVDAAVAAGPDTVLRFGRKDYRVGPRAGGMACISLVNVKRLTIDGRGAKLFVDPRCGVVDLHRCTDVTVRGFEVEYDPLPFTQGTIRATDAAAGTFDMEVHPGHHLPPPDDLVKKSFGPGGWQWGSVIDPVERHLRWGIADHFAIAAVQPVANNQRLYRIQMVENHRRNVAAIQAGDRFFLPLHLVGDNLRANGGNITVVGSGACTIADFTIRSARNGMVFAVIRNEGVIHLRGNRIAFAPGSDRIVTTWKDGMHCKNNRVGPHIEDCSFEGMLDDSINLSADTAMAAEVLAPDKFKLVGPPFAAGDEVCVFDPVAGEVVAQTRVREATQDGRECVVLLERALGGVVTGRKTPAVDLKATHFYNMTYANRGFIVRNCEFKPQRRHAVLVRCSDGVIENNRVDNIGGAAVWMGNEIGSFYEGPFPRHNVIRNNRIRATHADAIVVETSAIQPARQHPVRGIRIEDNDILLLPGRQAVRIMSAQDVTLRNNRITAIDGSPLTDGGITIRNSRNVTRQ